MTKIHPAILTQSREEFKFLFESYISAGFTGIDIDIQQIPFASQDTLSFTDALEVMRNITIPASIEISWDLKLEKPAEAAEAITNQYSNQEIIVYSDAQIANMLNKQNIQLGVDFDVSVKQITEMLDNVEKIQFMSVAENKQGGKLAEEVFAKIAEVRDLGFTGDIAIDGGVNLKSAEIIREHANDLHITQVSVGSYFQNAEDLNLNKYKLDLALNL